jgi:hypothetical protein
LDLGGMAGGCRVVTVFSADPFPALTVVVGRILEVIG